MTTDVVTRDAPWTLAAPWGARGYVSDLGAPVHWIEFDAPEGATAGDDAPPIVFVHGLGGSHLNWTLVGSALAAGRRAVALDLYGFGLTPGADVDARVFGNAALVHRFLGEIVREPAVLVGNSMGGMISILQTHQHPDTVAGLVLVDPALPAPRRRPDAKVVLPFVLYAIPGLGELYMRRMNLRLTSEQLVGRIIDICFADPSRASKEILDASMALVAAREPIPGKEASFLRAARSLIRLLLRPEGYNSMMRGITAPTLLIHGEADRLVPFEAARTAAANNPSWQTQFLPGVGHTPQLETPDLVIDGIRDWLAEQPGLAAR